VADATMSVGAPGVSGLETARVSDPYAGPITVGADYHTTAPRRWPALLAPMIVLGIVHPYAAVYRRLHQPCRGRRSPSAPAVGRPPRRRRHRRGTGQLSTPFGWNGVRHDYGNVNAGRACGADARDRAHVAWFTPDRRPDDPLLLLACKSPIIEVDYPR
jgi:hypothetical protein